MNTMRLSAAAIALVAGICSGISAFSAWWTLSASGTYSGTINFLPGDSLKGAFSGSSSTQTYASNGIGQVGALYEGVLAMTIVVMAIAFIAGIIGVILAVAKSRSQSTSRAFLGLSTVVIVVSLVAVLLVALAQPSIIAQHPAGSCGGYPGVKTPCNSFWGSVSGNGETVTWGADVGWYLEIVALVLGIAAFVVWRLSRPEPIEAPGAPVAAAVPSAVSTGVPVPAVTPPASVVETPPAAPVSERYCPACGARNLRASAFCESCGKPLPPRL